MSQNVANGQLAASATAIYTGVSDPVNVNVTLYNSSSSLTETVLLKYRPSGGSADRVIARYVLGPNQTGYLQGYPLNVGDILKGQTTDATTVDYTVGATTTDTPFGVFVLDANGGLQNASAVASATVAGLLKAQELQLTPSPTDTFAATMTIDMTYGSHLIAGSHTTSATCALTPSGAGSQGQIVTLELQETAGTGTIVWTFASTFHSNSTLTTASSQFSSITFISDGTRWVEMARTTSVA